MKKSKDIFTDKELEMVNLLMQDYESTNDIQSKLKRLFAGTIEQMLEAKVNEHLSYEKHCAEGSNSPDSGNECHRQTNISDYGQNTISMPRYRNREFEPKSSRKIIKPR